MQIQQKQCFARKSRKMDSMSSILSLPPLLNSHISHSFYYLWGLNPVCFGLLLVILDLVSLTHKANHPAIHHEMDREGKCLGSERPRVTYTVCWVTFMVSLLTAAARAVCSLLLQSLLPEPAPLVLGRFAVFPSRVDQDFQVPLKSSELHCLRVQLAEVVLNLSFGGNRTLKIRCSLMGLHTCVPARQESLLFVYDLFTLGRVTWGSPFACLIVNFWPWAADLIWSLDKIASVLCNGYWGFE